MLYFAYRYEDSNGYGPFFNERKDIYNWKDDAWRYGCTSIQKLNDWWQDKKDMNLKNYKIVKYIVDINDKDIPRIIKAREIGMIDFKLSEVLNKEDFE